MYTYDRAYTAIKKMGFSVTYHKRFDQLGIVCYTNGYIYVVLQNWDNGMTIETIENECQIIRSLLLELGANVWNAYYVLCSNPDNIDDDLAFFIERNSASLRKYILRTNSDLNRIPFLDDIQVENIRNPVTITEGLIETDIIASTLLTEVKRLDGHITNLNRKSVKDIVSLILTNRGDIN